MPSKKDNPFIQLIAAVMALCSVGFGVYIGFWCCFIGGIIDIVKEVKQDDVEALVVAFGVVKIMFSTLAGFAVGVVGLLLSALVASLGGFDFNR